MNDTRSKILDIAEDLVQRVGVNAMSYRDISDA
ncbi:MAG: TetR/AcrR family transcriptional regulator, partial [bacterium]|nr:TetR/AcrR family transcriptional regulator [bacterium]